MENQLIEEYIFQFKTKEEFENDLFKAKKLEEQIGILKYICSMDYIQYPSLKYQPILDNLFPKYQYEVSLIDLYKEEINLIDNKEIQDQKSLNELYSEISRDKLLELRGFWNDKVLKFEIELSSTKYNETESEIKSFTSLSEISKSKLKFYDNLVKGVDENSAPPIKIHGLTNQKIILLDEFGIIAYLRQIWLINKVKKGTVEELICFLTNEDVDSIGSRLANPWDEKKVRNPTAIEKANTYLEHFGLLTGTIKKPDFK